MTAQHESSVITYSDSDSLAARSEIFDRLKTYPGTPEETERSLGLFLRGSLLARILATSDIYSQIVGVPGVILDVGTWRGQTAILCENFRAIYEPLHFNRRIICFDTFRGYFGFADHDTSTDLHRDGSYDVGSEYAFYLDSLLKLHERSNAMGHNNGKHSIVTGDCRITIPKFFEENPNEIVALAFFDVNAVDPTAKSFNVIWERLVPGGICAFWQLTRSSVPAEGIVYNREILGKRGHSISRSAFYPGLCYLRK